MGSGVWAFPTRGGIPLVGFRLGAWRQSPPLGSVKMSLCDLWHVRPVCGRGGSLVARGWMSGKCSRCNVRFSFFFFFGGGSSLNSKPLCLAKMPSLSRVSSSGVRVQGFWQPECLDCLNRPWEPFRVT